MRAVTALALLATTALAGDLPKLDGNLPKGQCNSGPGSEGADSYFMGDFTVEGTAVRGKETWILFTNTKWAARGGKDCRLEWNITGMVTSNKGSCGSCDQGLQIHGEPIMSSDCPEDLVIGHRAPNGQRAGGEGVAFDENYAVQHNADGSAVVYYAKSGKRLGEGYHASNRLNYITDHQCKWF